MRAIILLMILFAPLISFAEGRPVTCRFSMRAGEHEYVRMASCRNCLCSHVVVCDDQKAYRVVCLGKNGICDGYDATGCFAQSTVMSEDAQFLPAFATSGEGGR